MILKPSKGILPIKGHPLSKGLVGCWLFNDNPPLLGKTLDISGRGNYGTLVGNTYPVYGKFGACLSFDGTGDYVGNLDTPISAFPFSINCWVKAATINDNEKAIVSLTDESGYNTYFQLMGYTYADYMYIGIQARNGGSVYEIGTSSPHTQPYNTWHMLTVIVSNSTSRKLFVDGKYIGESTNSVTFNSNIDIATIGAHIVEGSPGRYWNGTIDDVMIYNRALIASENQQLYRDPFCMFRREPIELWTGATSVGAGFKIPLAIHHYQMAGGL